MKKLFFTITALTAVVGAMLPAVFAMANETGVLDSVVISPATALVAANGTRQFTAISKDAANETAGNVTYTWAVFAGGGTINATSGLFTTGNDTGTFNGTVRVTAVQGNITRTANATVIVAVPGHLVSLAVFPSSATVAVNGTRQFTAVAKDAFNQNATGVNLTWSVVAGGGTINATSGLFTAGNDTGTFNGTVRVTAVQGNITGTANATVTVIVKTTNKPGIPPGWEKGKKKGWGDDDRPPGFDHGKKKGWDCSHTPPGIAKHDDDDGRENAPAAQKTGCGQHVQPANPCCDRDKDTANAGGNGKKGKD